MLKKLIVASLLSYLFGLLIGIFWLSHHPSTRPSPAPLFSDIPNIKERKAAFFGYFLPMIDRENNKLLKQRSRLASIAKKLETSPNLTGREQRDLDKLAKVFGLAETEPRSAQVNELLLRVDVIPPALVLAQAANESAWGQSRFAREGNNYFGQWCYKKGCGLLPSKRNANANHEVRKFNSPAASVAAYFRNINTHRAYAGLRALRAQLRAQGEIASGHALAAGLRSYSERGEEYITELRKMIKINKLE